jgi:hypothetical protein
MLPVKPSGGSRMAFCESCGKPVYRLDRTCANCGAPVTQFSQSSGSESRGRMNDDYSLSSSYDVLSSWGFAGSMIVMSLPIVGFIITIIWASGGATNLSRRNLARGYLILMGLGILFSIVLVLIMISAGISLDQIPTQLY